MSKRQRMSFQQVMKVLFEINDKVSSEDKDDFDDKLSWYESEPEMHAFSGLNSETDGSDTESENEDCTVCQEVRGKDGYLWRTEPKNARTPKRNIVTSTPGPKGKGLEADTPLKSFELFFDDSMVSEIATWTNQKIEMYVKDNVKDASFVRDRRTKSTDLLAINVTTPSAKNTAR